MVTCNIEENPNIKIIDQKGSFAVLEYQRDLSISPENAEMMYFFSKMGGKKRKLYAYCKRGIVLQPGNMEMISGDVTLTSGYKGVGDVVSKAFRSKVAGEKMTMPEYWGEGQVYTHPTYHHLVLLDISKWNGGIVLQDGIFKACEASLKQQTKMRSTVSSAVAGNEGLFNMMLTGEGIAVLELPCPYEELIEFNLVHDTLKIDGNMAIAWSPSLTFTVEKAGSSLFGSAVSEEGFVNVYRGTGRVLVRPTV